MKHPLVSTNSFSSNTVKKMYLSLAPYSAPSSAPSSASSASQSYALVRHQSQQGHGHTQGQGQGWQPTPTPFLSPSELFEKQTKLDKIRLDIYNKILGTVHQKIRTVARLPNSTQMTHFDVPEWQPGYPRFDPKDCVLYLVWNLRLAGFKVVYIPSNRLLISWRDHSEQYFMEESPIRQAMMASAASAATAAASAAASGGGGGATKPGGLKKKPSNYKPMSFTSRQGPSASASSSNITFI